MNLHVNVHAYIPCGHSEWMLRTRYLLVHLQTLTAETKLSASVVALLYAKVSDILFQDSSLYLSISRGCLFQTLPVGGDLTNRKCKSPHYPLYVPHGAGGVVGLDIDRCIRAVTGESL